MFFLFLIKKKHLTPLINLFVTTVLFFLMATIIKISISTKQKEIASRIIPTNLLASVSLKTSTIPEANNVIKDTNIFMIITAGILNFILSISTSVS